MKVLVCGGRKYADQDRVFAVLDKLSPTHVIHGGATGADDLAAKWCGLRDRDETVFRADWQKYGRAAGPIRNQRMLDEGKPDLVVAFPGGNGTADMVRRAREAGVRVNDLRTMEER